jgi:hypothetical protein
MVVSSLPTQYNTQPVANNLMLLNQIAKAGGTKTRKAPAKISELPSSVTRVYYKSATNNRTAQKASSAKMKKSLESQESRTVSFVNGLLKNPNKYRDIKVEIFANLNIYATYLEKNANYTFSPKAAAIERL